MSQTPVQPGEGTVVYLVHMPGGKTYIGQPPRDRARAGGRIVTPRLPLAPGPRSALESLPRTGLVSPAMTRRSCTDEQ